ncbi:uncharacterized protein LOC129609255 [Condylostylus longicornis]|uniref:uncharacterized protein LOC129609255 n=1 Tax=Condylostylus longicornis TaxID=2530218 RepID=UPI00244DA26C|nr:uncharacterized protein LOC129609255 [Condylostylus longicornis]
MEDLMETVRNDNIPDSDLYNADELIPPPWIDEEFFKTVLKTCKNDDFKNIIKYNISPATVKGDHYASIMFRGVVQYMDKENIQQEISMIIKTMPETDGTKKDFLNGSTIFEVEIEMFRDVIPKFEKMLNSIGYSKKLAANMLYYTLSPRKVIVLQDITKLGFSAMGKRLCTVEESKMALDKLAQWHACSYVLNKQLQGGLEKFVNGIYNMNGLIMNPWFMKGGERLAKLAHETPKLQKYAKKLDQIKDILLPKCSQVYDLCKKKGRLNVLTHGDFHLKNLMFKTNPKTQLSEELMLVDFQLCVWTSMCADLFYAIYLLVDLKRREECFDELIYDFFCKFRETLKLLNYNGKIPKFSDLQMDMLLLRRLEIYLTATFLPLIVALIENPKLDPDETLTHVEGQYKLYESQMYIDEVQPILERFLNRGYFDNILEDDDENDKCKIKNFTVVPAAREGDHIGGNVLRIPKFEKMLRDAGDNTKIGPRLLYSAEHPNMIMVLEDLSKSQYSDFSYKRSRIDDKTADLILDKLAKFHACSYKLNNENKNCLESFDNSIFKVNEHQLVDIMGGGVKQLIKVLKPLTNKDLKLKEIIEMLEKIEGKLNHGDFHIKNLMFKYDNKEMVQDVQVIDFAMCFWSSMAFDLLYVIYAIYTPELRLNKRHLEVWFSTTFLPLVYGIVQNSNVEEFTQKEDARLSMYNIPEFLKDIQLILKSCLNYGFLDESYYQ